MESGVHQRGVDTVASPTRWARRRRAMEGVAMSFRIRLLAVLAGLALVGALAPAALASTPSGLSTESLYGTPITQLTATCNPSGTSTISYTTSGTASGPYLGTYTESGTVTIGPQTLSVFVNGFQAGPVTSLDATFTITSTNGVISGSKHLDPAAVIPGFCYDFTDRTLPGGTPIVSGTFRELIPSSSGFGLTYTAKIATPNGYWTDSGISGMTLIQFRSTASLGSNPAQDDVFNEAYSSSGVTPCAWTMSAILPPFNTDGSSSWKYRSTVPVKVRITDCTGAPVPGLSPQVGTQLKSSVDPAGGIDEATSTSAADTGTTMRYDASAGQYVYNWASASVSDPSATYYMYVREPNSMGQAPDGTPIFGQSYQQFALKLK